LSQNVHFFIIYTIFIISLILIGKNIVLWTLEAFLTNAIKSDAI